MQVHDAGLAGRWYPGEAGSLRAEIESLLGRVRLGIKERTQAIVVPHAGYMYSGKAAAHAYALVQGQPFRRVLILAPSHYVGFRGAVTLAWDGFRTPLGLVSIDKDAVRELLGRELIVEDAAPFGPEHSLEIQLPFLQVVLPGVPVVPVLIGFLSREDVVRLAVTLQPWEESETLVVVSSDFTHYGARFDYLPFPARDAASVRARLHELDGGAFAALCAGDVDALDRYIEQTGVTICGRYPLLTFLGMHRRRTEGQLLCYYTSLEVTGDYEHVVSYAAVAFREAVDLSRRT